MSDFVTKIKVRGEEYDIRDAGAARIDSPEFTGIPLAPTADADTDSPQIATTAFVQRAVKDKFGKPGGIAILDENGKVPTSQLPSYVDDVLEGTYDEENNQFLDIDGNVYTPESDKIYVDVNTNTTYRWSGTLYIKIGGGSDEVPDGVVYINPDEASSDLPDIDAVTSAKYVSYNNIDSNLEATNVQDAIDTVASISKGKNRARVFNTTEDMNTWLSDEVNKGTAIVGDNLYIVALDVPDWWISEVLEEADADTGFFYKIAQLETQKVDLTTIESELNNKVSKTDIVDNLNSTATDLSLSANQGRILRNMLSTYTIFVPFTPSNDNNIKKYKWTQQSMNTGQDTTDIYMLYNIEITDDLINQQTGLNINNVIGVRNVSPIFKSGGVGFSRLLTGYWISDTKLYITLMVRNIGNASDISSTFTIQLVMFKYN